MIIPVRGWYKSRNDTFIYKNRIYECYGCSENIINTNVSYVRKLPWSLKPNEIKHNIITLCQKCFDMEIPAPKNWEQVIEYLNPSVTQYENIKKELNKRTLELEKSISNETDKITKLEKILDSVKNKRVTLEASANEHSLTLINITKNIVSARNELDSVMVDMSNKLLELSEKVRDSAPNMYECPICSDKSNIAVNVPCGHTMCDVCIHAQENCYVCRQSITKRIKLHFT